MLTLDPSQRISAEAALNDQWVQWNSQKGEENYLEVLKKPIMQTILDNVRAFNVSVLLDCADRPEDAASRAELLRQPNQPGRFRADSATLQRLRPQRRGQARLGRDR